MLTFIYFIFQNHHSKPPVLMCTTLLSKNFL